MSEHTPTPDRRDPSLDLSGPEAMARASAGPRARPPARKRSSAPLLGVLALAVAAAAGGGWWWWQGQQAAPAAGATDPDAVATVDAGGTAPAPRTDAPAATAPTPAGAPTDAAAAPLPSDYPIEQVDATEPEPALVPAGPLPEAQAADPTAVDVLGGLIGAELAQAFVVPEHVVPRIVASVDALPRDSLVRQVMPVRRVPGELLVQPIEADAEGRARALLDPANAERYESYVAAFEAMDARRAVATYVRGYPLFQQAYVDLGYPGQHFNTRLVQVIDHLLQAPPAPEAPPVLVRGVEGAWEFEDPALQRRSVGHKLFARLSPAQGERVKAKLRELRAVLAGG